MIFHLKSKAIAFETLQITATFQIVKSPLESKAIVFGIHEKMAQTQIMNFRLNSKAFETF